MKKEDFTALGLEDSIAEKCAEASEKELAGYIPKAQYDVATQAKETLELQAEEYTKQINLLKKSAGDTEKLNETIANLQDANKKAKAEYDSKVKTMQIEYAVDAALTNAKAKNLKAVKALLNLDELDVDDNGKVKGIDKQIRALREAKDTEFLFETGVNPKNGKPKVTGEGTEGDKKTETNDNGANGGLSIGAQMAQAYNSTVAPAGNGEKG